MIGCLPRVLEISLVVVDTEVPRILWVKCATSAECKTIWIAVSTVKDSWVTSLGLRPLVYKPVCVGRTTWVKSKDLTCLSWVGSHSLCVDICNLSSWLLEFSWCMSYELSNMSLHSKTSFPQKKFTYIMHCCILNQNMGFLWVHSKHSLACHWLFYWLGMKEHDMKKSTSVTNMRARTLPS